MKILHVYKTYFPDEPGGVQEVIKNICIGTKAFGITNKLFTLSKKPNPSLLRRLECDVTRGRSLLQLASCDIGDYNSFSEYRSLVGWSDIIHFHYPWPFEDLLNLVTREKKIKIVTYHSDIVRQKTLEILYSPLRNTFMRDMSAIVATSQNYYKSSEYLKQPLIEKKIRIIPIGIFSTRNQEESSKEIAIKSIQSEPFLLFLGALRYYKGVKNLIEAANNIRGNIIIAGEGNEKKVLEEQARNLNVRNVHFLGNVCESDKNYLLSSCRGLILPSSLRSEAYGVVLVEALMHGKPIVSCEIGTGTSFVNKHNETGFVINPNSPYDLSQACNKILEDRELAIKFSSNARHRYLNLFTGERMAKSYYDLYQELMQQSH